MPHEERHGEVWHLGGVWFSGNAELTTTASGVLAISLGGNLIWTMIGLLLGTLFGTFFTAFHSAQGPQLGLPQMIQSRAQFGYIGVAVLVLPFMVFNYAGYNVFNGLLAAGAMENVVGGDIKFWLVVVSAVALLAAIWGYDLIHLSQRWLTYAFIVFFGIYTDRRAGHDRLPGQRVGSRRLPDDAVPGVVRDHGLVPDRLGAVRVRLLALPAGLGGRQEHVHVDVLAARHRRRVDVLDGRHHRRPDRRPGTEHGRRDPHHW